MAKTRALSTRIEMIAASQKAKDPLVKPKPSASPGHQAGEHTASAAARVEYVCPMHPQIVRSEPGSCPICGMTLEPQTITADEKENPELRDMTRRF